jgi:hypothetical protein
MDDRELKELLQRIPRASAPPEFRERLAGRLDRAERRMRARRRALPVVAFAVALAIGAGATLLWNWHRSATLREERIERARLEDLELEYRDIEQEVADLQRLLATAHPVVGVEGPGERGYLLDVGELARASADGAVPVAYRLPH